MSEKITPYDPAEYLDSEESVAAFMEDAFASGDAGFIAHALGVVARARGMTEIARESGLTREHLYKSFSENGNPTLKTLLALLNALKITVHCSPASVQSPATV
jgi:probable addiction module antidote protein